LLSIYETNVEPAPAMSEPTRWDEIRREEQALLRQCKQFVFGDPDSPGWGSKDILYYTPCKRWLRICSGDHDYNDPDYRGVEIVTQVNSKKACELFDAYLWERPAELEIPNAQRDFEVAGDLPVSLAEFLDVMMVKPPSRLYSIPKERCAGESEDNLVSVPDAATIASEGSAEMDIERNSLLHMLTKWAAGWSAESLPRSLEELAASLAPSKKMIIRALDQSSYLSTRRRGSLRSIVDPGFPTTR
jgi:hypothetical protein